VRPVVETREGDRLQCLGVARVALDGLQVHRQQRRLDLWLQRVDLDPGDLGEVDAGADGRLAEAALFVAAQTTGDHDLARRRGDVWFEAREEPTVDEDGRAVT